MRTLAILVLAIIGAIIALKIVTGLLAIALHFVIPVLVLGAIGYGIYALSSPKGLSGGRRYLP